MKIFLIGMPGSGKSTIGQKVADALSLAFIDLDKQIELREGKSIPEIFSGNGEDYFRETESAVLRELCAKDESYVMATGGGAPCFYNNIDVLNESGLTVFLDVDVNTLLERVSRATNRPLLSDKEGQQKRLQELYESRRACYMKAMISLRNPDASAVLQAITHTTSKK
ncbi:MAG TPA: shikimate kinase [Ohtaekwangia sp.]|nr:shikimate kinase [Ohtaekwangia sp.]